MARDHYQHNCPKSKKILIYDKDMDNIMIHDCSNGKDYPFPILKDELMKFCQMLFKDEIIELIRDTDFTLT